MKHITHDWIWDGGDIAAPFSVPTRRIIRLDRDAAKYTAQQLDALCAVVAETPWHIYQFWTEDPGWLNKYWTTSRGSNLDSSGLMDCGIAWGRESLIRQATIPLFRGRPFPDFAIKFPLPNLWLGTVIHDQSEANHRIPLLLQTPAAGRMVHCRVGMEEIDFEVEGTLCKACGGSAVHCDPCSWTGFDEEPYSLLDGIDWVTISGDVGPDARPCDLAVVESLVDQCYGSGVPCCVVRLGSNPRQIKKGQVLVGEDSIPPDLIFSHLLTGDGSNPAEWPADLRVRQYPQAFQVRD